MKDTKLLLSLSKTKVELDYERNIITSTFADGKINIFHLWGLKDDPEYAKIARWAGYSDDWRLYGIHHELTHHWLSQRLFWPWSFVVHDDPPVMEDDTIYAWEEHIVNHMQKYMREHLDDPYGVIQAVFKDQLGYAADSLYCFWRDYGPA